MMEDWDCTCHTCLLPVEILEHIFKYLPAKELTKCREVCTRWKEIIDDMARREELWSKFCNKDYKNVCAIARRKSKPGLRWFHLYRSLTLWRRIAYFQEVIDEFASASNSDDEIRNFEILENGIVGVHKKTSIVYYNVDALDICQRRSIAGDYSRYTENECVIALLSYQLHLFVIRKTQMSSDEESNVTFDNVKLFTLTDNELYFVNINDEIFVCKFGNKNLTATFLKQSDDGIMSLGYSEGFLNVLTFQRDIYCIIGNNLVYMCSLGSDTNLLHQLHKHNFLAQLDWRVYFQWMYVLNHAVPNGPLRDIIVIRPYGDVYFVGSNMGVLRIYYAPYSDGEFNIFNTHPVKQYNFMERSDCPVLSTCPILQVDVLEREDGPTVMVGMPKKIVVIHFTHTFKKVMALTVLPVNPPAIPPAPPAPPADPVA